MSRWSIKVQVPTTPGEDDLDVRWRAVEAMRKLGASEIRDFEDVGFYGRLRKFRATAERSQ